MQTTGHLVINGNKILVLVRHKQYSRQFKRRYGGTDGNRFVDEEIHLIANSQKLTALLRGQVVEL